MTLDSFGKVSVIRRDLLESSHGWERRCTHSLLTARTHFLIAAVVVLLSTPTGTASWGETPPQRCQASFQPSASHQFGSGRMLEKKKKMKGRQFNRDKKPLFVVEVPNGFILNSRASKSDVSINFNLLSLLLIFAIVHRLPLVTVFSSETLTKAASGTMDEGHRRYFTSSRL